MERLWSPWRAKYIASGVDSQTPGCVFCTIARAPENDEKNFVIHRGQHCLVVLNLFPYITGHLLIVPYEHIGDLAACPKPTTDEMMDLAKRSQVVLTNVYNPNGFNLGINLGAAAGAGIVDHVHLHVLPRWSGDTNFMTTIGEARVLPETLEATYARLRDKF